MYNIIHKTHVVGKKTLDGPYDSIYVYKHRFFTHPRYDTINWCQYLLAGSPSLQTYYCCCCCKQIIQESYDEQNARTYMPDTHDPIYKKTNKQKTGNDRHRSHLIGPSRQKTTVPAWLTYIQISQYENTRKKEVSLRPNPRGKKKKKSDEETGTDRPTDRHRSLT